MSDVAPSNQATPVPDRADRARRWSHDLRGRLHCVLGFAQFIHDGKAGPISAEQREYLGDIESSAREALALVDEAMMRILGIETRASAATARTVAEPAGEPGRRKPSILVIEDDADDRA